MYSFVSARRGAPFACCFLASAPCFGQSSQLEPVTITATRYEEDTRIVPAYLTSITRKQIEQSNVQTVNEAIIRLASVSSRPSLMGGNEHTLDLMGFGDTAYSNTVILIDGVPLKEGDGSETRLSGVPIEAVERIEVQRSSGSVLYGGGATAGVINVITRATATASGSGSASSSSSAYAGAGSFGSREYRVNAHHESGAWAFAFSGIDRDSDGYRRHSSSEDQSGYFSVRFSHGALRAGLNFSREDQRAKTPGSISLAEFRQDKRAAQASSVLNNTRGSSETSKYAGFVETDILGWVLKLDLHHRSRDYDAVAAFGGFPVSLEFRGDSDYYGLSMRKDSSFAVGRNQFIFGVERSDWNQSRQYPGSTLGAYDLDFRSTSYFLKNDVDLDAIGSRVSFGYRVEENNRSQLALKNRQSVDNDYTESAWEFGVSKALGANHHFYGRLARSYRFANIDEFATSNDLDYNVVALRPQTSRDVEVGWKGRFAERGRADVRLYRSRLDDEIAFDNFIGSSFGYPVSSNINLDPTRRQGADVDVSWAVVPSVLMSASMSLRDARFKSGVHSGNRVPMSAKEVLTLRADWYPAANQTLGVSSTRVSSQYAAVDFDNEYRIPSYQTTDLRYVYDGGGFVFSLVARNVFDKSYYSYATRAWDETYTSRYVAIYPDQGRSLWASIRLKFE